MNSDRLIRWGILGTANITKSAFLPGLRAAGGGVAYAIAGRDPARTQRYARENEIERAVVGYANLLADNQIDAVYIALPNALHAQWTIAALRSDKAVLCEKPLCISVKETETVLDVARQSKQPLWESFVFLFRDQTKRLQEVIASDHIGEVREIQSNFHFLLDNRNNIRLNKELGGGALYDVGCYPIRLANLLFGNAPYHGVALARWAQEDVDEELQGILNFPRGRRLLLSCGMSRPLDTFTRVIGSKGEIRITNPFHPTSLDTLEIRRDKCIAIEHDAGPEPSFTSAIRHIHAVLREEVEPQYLAIDGSIATAIGIGLLLRSARYATHEST